MALVPPHERCPALRLDHHHARAHLGHRQRQHQLHAAEEASRLCKASTATVGALTRLGLGANKRPSPAIWQGVQLHADLDHICVLEAVLVRHPRPPVCDNMSFQSRHAERTLVSDSIAACRSRQGMAAGPCPGRRKQAGSGAHRWGWCTRLPPRRTGRWSRTP